MARGNQAGTTLALTIAEGRSSVCVEPTLERGFHSALADLASSRALVVHPASGSYWLSTLAIGLTELCTQAYIRSGR